MEGLPRQRAPEPDAGSELTGARSELTGARSELTGARSELTGAGSELTGAGSAAGPPPDPESAAGQGVATRLTALQVIAGDEPQVRAIRFDQPLQEGAAARLGWADPEIENRLERAAQQARERAQSLGYAAGWAQGRQAAAERERLEAAEREVAAARTLQDERIRIQALLETLGEVSRQTALAAVPAWTELADAIADGALAIARAALGRELSAVDAEVADAVRAALRTLASAEEVSVHVHPRDLHVLRRLVGAELPEHVHLTADPQVPPGGVLAATPVQRLRRDLPAAVARAEEVLRS